MDEIQGPLLIFGGSEAFDSGGPRYHCLDSGQVRANIISHNNVLFACKQTDQWPRALQILSSMVAWMLGTSY